MGKYLVLVVDGARARLLSLEQVSNPRNTRGLVEHLDLVNPDHQLLPHERLTSDRSESVSRVNGRWYGLDGDHRSKQDMEHEHRFANLIAKEVKRIAREKGASYLALVAAPKMIGLLREAGKDWGKMGLEVHEHRNDLSKLSLPELQQHLERANVLPPAGT